MPLVSTGKNPEGSMLRDETKSMERMRRIAEQEEHSKRFARVNARDHDLSEQTPSGDPEGELQNDIMMHPYFVNSQNKDGADINVNDIPQNNRGAKREFDNKRREQAMEKQLRLGNMPRFTSTPKPRGP